MAGPFLSARSSVQLVVSPVIHMPAPRTCLPVPDDQIDGRDRQQGDKRVGDNYSGFDGRCPDENERDSEVLHDRR